MTAFIDKLFRRYTPDPYLIAVALTLFVGVLSFLLTPSTPLEIVSSWGNGFWSLITFTLQMCMILVGGYIVATSPLVRRILKALARIPRTPTQCIIWVSFISALACWLNWGFGLIVGAFLALESARWRNDMSFPVLVASAYSGFLLWHGGLSGSIPLVVNTAGNFSLQWTQRLIPVSETLFSAFNLVTVVGLLFGLPLFNAWLHKKYPSVPVEVPPEPLPARLSPPTSPAERWEGSTASAALMGVLALAYVISNAFTGTFSLDLNSINFIFLFCGIVLHGTPRSFLSSLGEASQKLGPLLIQYPLYAGIMGIMVTTGLAQIISEGFVTLATAETFPFMSFISAGLVNLFVPSGGGQWAVQAPIVLPAAKSIGASLPLTTMAVAWGDAWTNMLQPFWALPLLAIAGLKAKDILGFCLMILLFSGAWISLTLILFGYFA